MTDTIVQPKTSKRVRSSAYPYLSIEQAIEKTEELRKNLGIGPYSRESASKAIGHEKITGSSASKIAALVHFGLLSRGGNTYSQTELANRILYHVSEEDRELAIKEAVKTPKLYLSLIDRYTGSSLPVMLNNILVREYGINENVANDVAENFKLSLEYAKLLENGVVMDKIASKEIAAEKHDTPTGTTKVGEITSERGVKGVKTDGDIYPIHLPSGIEIRFPSQMGYNFALGEFSAAIKLLEEKAQEILKGKNDKEPLPASGEPSSSAKKLEKP